MIFIIPKHKPENKQIKRVTTHACRLRTYSFQERNSHPQIKDVVSGIKQKLIRIMQPMPTRQQQPLKLFDFHFPVFLFYFFSFPAIFIVTRANHDFFFPLDERPTKSIKKLTADRVKFHTKTQTQNFIETFITLREGVYI